MKTHIETLADPTPKARRRIRRILNLATEAPIAPDHPARAQALARQKETRHQRKIHD